MNRRLLILGMFTLLALGMVFGPLKDLMNSAVGVDSYSHIVLIPLVSAYLFYRDRKAVFSKPGPVYPLALVLLAIGAAVYSIGYSQGSRLNQNDYASLLTFSAVVFWAGGFALLYGPNTLAKAFFGILFLVFMIPIPSLIMDKIIYALQVGSTEASGLLFTLIGVPFHREGFIFQLPGISVKVAEECSGIRSSLSLFIISILAGHFYLDRFWKRVILALVVFPVTVFKNGIRITILSLLGAYVDERWLTESSLHHSGGFVFFIPAVGLLGVALWGLKKAGRKSRKEEGKGETRRTKIQGRGMRPEEQG